VIVALDTLRPDHLGCYGHERDTSPALDALAARSHLFEGAQSVAPWTAPAMISIMTSLYPDVHQVKGFPEPGRLGGGVDTLAEILDRRGYATAAFTEGGYAKGSFGLDQGFDLYPANPGDEHSHTSNIDEGSRLAGNLDRFLDWLAELEEEEPFFAFFQTYEVHSPLRAPEAYIQRFVPDYDEAFEHEAVADVLDAWNRNRELGPDGARLLQRHFVHCDLNAYGIQDRNDLMQLAEILGAPLVHKEIARDADLVEWVRALYDAEVRYLDDELARLFGALEENGQADDTVVVVVSDHGEGLGAHGLLGHGGVLHSELLDVVFLLHVPGGPSPRRIDFPARLVDVAPTALELLDVDPGPNHFQGRSLVPLLAGDELEPLPSFSHAVNRGVPRHSVLRGPWRLIVEDESGVDRLYHLERDPGELDDVAGAHPDVVAELRALLESQRIADAELRERIGATPEESELDSATLEELQRLGYVGEDVEGAGEDE